MAVPAYLWLYNQSGTLISGGSDVVNREDAIEMQSLNQGVHRCGNTNRVCNVKTF